MLGTFKLTCDLGNEITLCALCREERFGEEANCMEGLRGMVNKKLSKSLK
jgi:hypothetical protein